MHLALQDRHLRISYYVLRSLAHIGSLGDLSIETQQTVVRDIVTLPYSGPPTLHSTLHSTLQYIGSTTCNSLIDF